MQESCDLKFFKKDFDFIHFDIIKTIFKYTKKNCVFAWNYFSLHRTKKDPDDPERTQKDLEGPRRT